MDCVTLKNASGSHPFCAAAVHGHLAVVKLLLDRKADVNYSAAVRACLVRGSGCRGVVFGFKSVAGIVLVDKA